MHSIYPSQIQSSVNGSLDLFTGIFYVIRLLGVGQGIVRPSPICSSNGGLFLEQELFPKENPNGNANLWYFEQSSTPTYYEWGLHSQPKARVGWTSEERVGESFPLQLKNLSDITQDIYEPDPFSTFWEFEPFSLHNLGGGKGAFGYKIRGMTSPSQNSVTFSSAQKSSGGYFLQINNAPDVQDEQIGRFTADHLMVFEPTNFKLYAEIAHMDIGNPNGILNTLRVKEYLKVNQILRNPGANDTTQNITVKGTVKYNVFVEADKEFNLFAGITVINHKTKPSRKYFDFEQEPKPDGILNLEGVARVKGTEEIELEPFSTKNYSAYVTYFKEFRGVRYYSWADVTGVADMMGTNGHVVKNVLVKDVSLLKHLIKSRGYTGEFRTINSVKGLMEDGAKIRIKVRGSIRGSLPIPFIQFEEGPSTHVPQFESEYQRQRN